MCGFYIQSKTKEMKRSFWILLLLIISSFGYSQEKIRELTFSVVSTDKEAFHRKKTYLIKDNDVYKSQFLYDGKVGYQIQSDLSLDNLFFSLSDNGERIIRVNVGNALSYGKPITTPLGEISVIGDRLIDILEENKTTEAVLSSFFRFPDLSLFTKEHQIDRFGYLRWYFPTELLISKDSVYDDYLSQWYNEEKYYRDFGQYPKEGFIDSIKMKRFEERAENLSGWYSEQLIILNEPILCNGYSKEVYRFTWSYNTSYYIYNPFSIRIEPDENVGALMYCSYNRWNDCDGYMHHFDVFFLDQNKYSFFLELIEEASFWNSKPMMDNGGSNLILEAFKDGRYHVIFRGRNQNKRLDEIQDFLWGLLGFEENAIIQPRQRIE